MAYEHKEGQGSLFCNEKQNDRQPDYKGTIVIEGRSYEIAAWKKTARSGKEYLSLQASEPREKSEEPAYSHAYSVPQPSAPEYQVEEFPVAPEYEDLPF